MSFILEALKKSEQQRQQQNALPQQVRKRTLFMPYRRSNLRFYWLLTATLFLLTFCAWWLYSNGVTSPIQPLVEKSVPLVVHQTEAPESAAKGAIVETAQQPLAIIAEPAPVPRDVFSVTTPLSPDSRPVPAATSAQPRQARPSPRVEPREKSEYVAAEVLLSKEPQGLEGYPLYSDLSGELRARMPRLTMSMHFYAAEPVRRLARINDRLLHEGDWVEQDLRLVAITINGVTLDFMGKLFEIRSQNR